MKKVYTAPACDTVLLTQGELMSITSTSDGLTITVDPSQTTDENLSRGKDFDWEADEEW